MHQSFTLDRDIGTPKEGDVAPDAIHWCLSQPTVPMHEIGADGASRERCVYAVCAFAALHVGGRNQFQVPLHIGYEVERISTVKSVSVKEGKSGTLCFVVVEHYCSTKRELALVEDKGIIYRGAESGSGSAHQKQDELPKTDVTREIEANPVLLFQYSAVTFNGHRIHYDRDYVTKVETYPGLIVHGPLQATLLVDLAKVLKPNWDLKIF